MRQILIYSYIYIYNKLVKWWQKVTSNRIDYNVGLMSTGSKVNRIVLSHLVTNEASGIGMSYI